MQVHSREVKLHTASYLQIQCSAQNPISPAPYPSETFISHLLKTALTKVELGTLVDA